jgi:NADH-quinone oxidoreductase subunit E
MIIIIILSYNKMIEEKLFLPQIENILKNNGLKLTKPRKTIISVLLKSKESLSTEDIYIKSHKKTSNIGIASIYRNLNIFESLGIIKKINSNDGKKKFIIATNKISKDISIDLSNKIQNPKSRDLSVISTNRLNKDLAGVRTKEYIPQKSIDYGNKDKQLHTVGLTKSYTDINKIIKMQSILNEKILELSKSRKEKEIDLEEIMSDFKKLDNIIENHEYNKGNLIQILLDCQEEYKWLPKHVLFYVGQKLDVSLTQVYSIASFYKFFSLEPKGKYSITVCAGTACHVRGSMNLLQKIVNILNIKPGDTTQDFKFTLDTVNCLGCCALGPVMLFNNKYYSNPSTKELEKMFNNVH